MASKELTYKITTDSKQAVAGIKQFSSAVKKEMKGAADALDDTRSAGKKAADALSAMADQMEADLKASAAAADALGTALGDTADHLDVGQAVADLNKMGLTFDEIRADADALADALKRVDGAKVDGAGSGVKQIGADADAAADDVKRLGSESDQTGSVMANMAGNSAGELAEVGGAAGVAAGAIGQLAEYATEGNISLRRLAGLAAPMVGLAVATQAVSDYMAGIQAEKAFDAELLEKFAAGIREGKTAIQVVNEELRDTGTLMANVSGSGGFLGLKGEAKDLAQLYRDAGLSYAQFQADLADTSAVDRMNQAWLDNALTDKGQMFHDIADGLEDYQTGAGAAATRSKELAEWMGTTADQVNAYEQAQRLANTAIDGAANSLAQQVIAQEAAAVRAEEHAAALEAVADAATASAAACDAMVEGFVNSADAELKAVEAAEDYAATLKDSKASTDDQRDAAIDSAKANVEWAKKMADAKGVALSTTDEVDALNDSLIDNAAQASGPTRKAILDYVASLNAIEPTKATEIEAAIAAGDLDTAKRLLDEASAPRYVAVVADAETAAATAALDAAAKDRDAKITAVVTLPNGWKLHKDGTVHGPGGIVVQSLPPIAPTPPPAGGVGVAATAHVAPAATSSTAVAPAAPHFIGAGNVTLNVYPRTEAAGRAVTRELEKWARVNGGRRR